MEFWVPAAGGPGGRGCVDGSISYGGTHGFAVSWAADNGCSNFTVGVSGDPGSSFSLLVPQTTAWMLFDVTYHGTTATVYTDGQNIGSGPLTATTTVPGAGLTTSGRGPLDELAIYPTALSPSRIDAHWSVGASPSGATCAAAPISAYSQRVISDRPVAYYRLDDLSTPGQSVAYDSSGNCNNGNLTGTNVPGALASDPNDTALSLGRVSSSDGVLPSGGAPRTVEFWVPAAGGPGGRGCVDGSISYGGTHGFAVSWAADNGCFKFTVEVSGDPGSSFSLLVPQTTAWMLFDVTYNGTTATVYTDGQNMGSGPLTATTTVPGAGLTASGRGPLDELAIYPTALTPSQVADDFAVGANTGPIGGPYAGPQTYGGGSLCIPCAINKDVHAIIGLPVDTATGDMFHTFSDIAIPGRGLPLAFTRTYNSLTPSTTGPFGYGWTFAYNDSLSLDGSQNATITQENGSQTSFVTNGGTCTPAAPRDIATLVHNGDGTWTFTRQAREILTFNAAGQLTAERDLNGYTTTLSYTAGQLSSITDPAGRSLAVVWSGGNITSLTDTNVTPTRTVLYSYNDGAGNLTDVTDVAGGNWHFTYDPNHRMLTMRDPRGNTVTNGYDPSTGQITSQSDQLNRQTTFGYSGDNSSAAGGTTTVTDPKGNVTVETYQYGLLMQRTKGNGTAQAATWHYMYDPATMGQTSVIDPNGHTTSMAYDSQGNLLTTTDALGRETVNTYNSLNEQLTTTDPKHGTTTMVYDSAGNLQRISRPLSSTKTQVTVYHYADSPHPGDVTSMTDADGHTWTYAYDAFGDRVSSADPLGDSTTSTFNADGLTMTTVSPKGNVTGANPALYRTSFTYNAFGDLTTVTDPLGHVTTSGYDANRNLTSAKDAKGNLTTYTYDTANEQTVVTRADGTTLSTDYNPDGTVLDQLDGKGNATTYAYDALARVTSVTDPLGRITTSTYDGAGDRLTTTDPQSQTTTYTYDAANQLTSVHYSDGMTPNVTSVQYDADGQRISMTDGTGTSTWAWDNLNRMTASTEAQGGGVVATVKYSYDLNGQLTNITYPAGSIVVRRYDSAGRLIAVTDWLKHTTTFSYDGNSNLTVENFPKAGTTAIKDTFTYDQVDQLVKSVDTVGKKTIASFTDTRDANNQLASEASSGVPPPPSDSYTYTTLNQLHSANSATYGYDAADNITALTSGATLTYDNANQLTQSVQGATTTTYGYDPRGNRTSQSPAGGSATTYTYDQANRLTGYGSTATYSYNGDGLRMRKFVGGVAEAFVWDVAESLPLLIGDSSTRYVMGPGGLPLEQVSGRTVLYYHHDQLGSTRAITDGAGTVTSTYTYDPYGNLTASTGTVVNPLQFGGQYEDRESGLMYLRARYYDPQTDQFLTRDPLVEMTRTPYAYGEENPLNAVDPTGLQFDTGSCGDLGGCFAKPQPDDAGPPQSGAAKKEEGPPVVSGGIGSGLPVLVRSYPGPPDPWQLGGLHKAPNPGPILTPDPPTSDLCVPLSPGSPVKKIGP